MHPKLLDEFPEWTGKYEAVVPYMYLDVKGIVTFGIGHAAFSSDTVANLPWYHKGTDVRATEAQIRNEWASVRDNKMLAKHGIFNGHAANFTRLRMKIEDVYEDARNVMRHNHAVMLKQYPDMESWPLDAQMATHSMAWACGPAFGLPGPNRFVTLAKHLRDADFNRASEHCHMNETGNAGLIPRNIANKLMYRNSADVIARGMDPHVIYWPKDLRKAPKDVPSQAVSKPEAGHEEPMLIVRDMNSYFPERNK